MISLGSLEEERLSIHGDCISSPLIRQFCFYESIVVIAMLNKMWNWLSQRKHKLLALKCTVPVHGENGRGIFIPSP